MVHSTTTTERVKETLVKGGGKETLRRETVRKTVTRKGLRQSRPQGVVLYRGPSLIDGTPVVAVATGLVRRSKNTKTGGLVQTFILADQDEDPLQARKSGADFAICGDCPHRCGSCFVDLSKPPLSVWRAARRGSYEAYNRAKHAHLFQGRVIRLGYYGDPAAVPLPVWEEVVRQAGDWRGYTHQWRVCDPGFSRLCMASVDSPSQRLEALARGFRTFRIRLPGQDLEPGEFVCPASKEAGHRLTCEQCRACAGAMQGEHNATPAIFLHATTIAGGWAAKEYTRRVGLPLVG